MTLVVYHYPKCGTCKKAIRWLNDQGIGYSLVDIVENPPSKNQLKKLWKRSGLPIQKLFNTSGKLYREGGYRDRIKTMSEDEALAELAAHGKLIKRPLVAGTRAGDEVALVGFREAAYAEAFAPLKT